MLEFTLEGKLISALDAGQPYAPVGRLETSSYGLDTNNSIADSSINLLHDQDPIATSDETIPNNSSRRPQDNGDYLQSRNALPTPIGVSLASDSSNQTANDVLTGTTLDTDQNRQDIEATPNASAEPLEFDQLTGNTEAGFVGLMPKPSISIPTIDPAAFSHLGERLEVNNLLAEERFNRDQSTGTQTHYNFTSETSFSANEGDEKDITDSFSNAAELGTVAYRDNKKVIGTVGYGTGSHRDHVDYFSFYAGKTGTYNLSLSNLDANVGLALYNESGSFLTRSNNSGTQDESINIHLNEGHYTSLVYSYNTSSRNNNGATLFTLDISRQGDEAEQLTNRLIDDNSIKNAVLNSIKYDNDFDRNDTIGILKSAGDNETVSDIELTDLRQFWNNFSTSMNADIAGLSKKVVFGDDSNTGYTGYDSVCEELGNLESDSTTQKLNLLIGKHMLGTDRPAIHSDDEGNVVGIYTKAAGTLEINGFEAGDIDQGATGSCYFLSALAGTANDKPEILEDMFVDNGDGTYSVRFFTNGKADYVTVDNKMATSATGHYIYADAGDGSATDSLVATHNELWVALAEKAYAQLNESGRLDQQEATNSYGIAQDEGISWGLLANGIEHVTGLSASAEDITFSSFNGVSSSELQALVNGDNVVTVLWNGHARSIVGYDWLTGDYDIRNPNDEDHSSLTHGELVNLGAKVRWSNS